MPIILQVLFGRSEMAGHLRKAIAQGARESVTCYICPQRLPQANMVVPEWAKHLKNLILTTLVKFLTEFCISPCCH